MKNALFTPVVMDYLSDRIGNHDSCWCSICNLLNVSHLKHGEVGKMDSPIEVFHSFVYYSKKTGGGGEGKTKERKGERGQRYDLTCGLSVPL